MLTKAHSAIICGATGFGKTEFVLNLHETLQATRTFVCTSSLFVPLGVIIKLI